MIISSITSQFGAAAGASREAADQEVDHLAPPEPEFLMAAVEAVLFGCDQPLTSDAIRVALNIELDGAVEGALELLREAYQDRGAGMELVEVAGLFFDMPVALSKTCDIRSTVLHCDRLY